jgi:hypothetical protein
MMITNYSDFGLNLLFEYKTSVVYSSINRSRESKTNLQRGGKIMTQRQRKYWREMTKLSNYTAILKAVKGPEFIEDIDFSDCGRDLNARTRLVEEKVHMMYATLKSLGAINVAQKVIKGENISKAMLDSFIEEAKQEILDLNDDNEIVKSEEDV